MIIVSGRNVPVPRCGGMILIVMSASITARGGGSAGDREP
jgi:hypothetical protein